MESKPFVFIGDLFETREKKSIHLFDSYYLKKATLKQQLIIKECLNNYVAISFSKINKYECDFKKNGNGYNIIPLEKQYWKYFVIEHSESQAKRNFNLILALSTLDLTPLFQTIHFDKRSNTPGISHNQLNIFNYFHDSSYINLAPDIKLLDKTSIDELKKINFLIEEFNKDKYPFIGKALNDFLSIKDISVRSPFKILSCFSVLELLLTTYRKGSNDNSLSNQLRKKTNLLNNQFQNKIDITSYFKVPDTVNLEILIEKMYQYRNDIAHGNMSDFEKELFVFKKQEKNILPFLLNFIRKTLIFSLEKPQLIKDLKEC